jgi:hypothetical protein
MYLVAYPTQPSDGLKVLNWCIEGLFYIDFIFNFF